MDNTVKPEDTSAEEFGLPPIPAGRGLQKNAAGQMSLRWYRRHFGDATYNALRAWERIIRNTAVVEGPAVPQSPLEEAKIAS